MSLAEQIYQITKVRLGVNTLKRLLGTIGDNHDLKLKGLRISMKDYIDQVWMENIPFYAITSFV